MSVTEFYCNLLIKQYSDLPKAKAEIALLGAEFEAVNDFYNDIANSFDLDTATAHRLDLIGKLVGISRIVPFSTPKELFGFEGDPSARGFDSLFDPLIEGAPFASVFSNNYRDTELNDNEYRLFIRAKIAKNVVRAVMVGDDETISLQDAIQIIFEGAGVVLDNKNMTLTLQVPYEFDTTLLGLIVLSDLLPRPQGVDYKVIIRADFDGFGFSNDPAAQGFSSVFDPTLGGRFASLYI